MITSAKNLKQLKQYTRNSSNNNKRTNNTLNKGNNKMRIIPFRIKASLEEDNFSDVYAFLIQGTKKDAYEVEIDIDSANDIGITDKRCTCPHSQFRGVECKHIKECVKILGCFNIKTEFVEEKQ